MIIGIAGRAGSGKDTAANYLKTKGFKHVSFAGILKDMLKVAGLPEPLDREQKEELIPGIGFSWRQAAQTLGTEWGRSLHPDLWVRLLERKLDPKQNYVISDVRFENEADLVRRHGVMVFLHGRSAKLAEETASHASEAGILIHPASDFIVDNKRTMAELYTQLDTVLHYGGYNQ